MMMFWRIGYTIAVLTIGFLAGIAVKDAVAHDWYPLACCSGIDCGPASDGEIRYTPAGWLVVPTGEVIAFDKAQESPDGKFHRCTMKARDPKSKTRCLFVPPTGT